MASLRWSSVFYNLCFALNCLLLFLALFGAKMDLPSPLQVAGRMHPLVLHFPIVLLVLAVVWEATVRAASQPMLQNLGDTLMLAAAVSAALSALLGLFLSKTGEYETETLLWHQWSGVALSLMAMSWYSFRRFFRAKKLAATLFVSIVMTLVLLAGHYGATLTHGENYLFGPLDADEPPPLEDALVFEHLVRPILKAKCMSCHNSTKAKGDLSMETQALLLKGGKNGRLWDSTETQSGLLMNRIHLPLEDKEHMPPKGKVQLTGEELEILSLWVKSGASFSKKVADLPDNDNLRQLAKTRLKSEPARPYPFAAADEEIVQKLNNDYRVVSPLSQHSPALEVEFYGASAFNPVWLKELDGVKTQVISLNLNKMPLKDEDLKFVASFTNLQKLNLAFTAITGTTLGELKTLKSLQSLSLSGTSVKAGDLEFLSILSKLSVLYLWNTAVVEQDLETLRLQFPKLRIESGFSGEGIVAKLNAPIIEGEEQVFSGSTKVRLKNYIRGAELRYTLDGSVPDSLSSPVCTGDSISIDQSCQLMAKAFLSGWISSDVSTKSFYKAGFLPDSVVLLFPPNEQYKGEGAKTLSNKKVGDTEFRTNKWLGYKETNLEALLLFEQPVMLSSVSFSTLVDIGSYIMPAAEIQVWGGPSPKNLKLLKKLNPKQPDKVGAPGYRLGFNCRFKPQKLGILKIVAKPVTKLPAWHPGKGERGWVFVDEVFLE